MVRNFTKARKRELCEVAAKTLDEISMATTDRRCRQAKKELAAAVDRLVPANRTPEAVRKLQEISLELEGDIHERHRRELLMSGLSTEKVDQAVADKQEIVRKVINPALGIPKRWLSFFNP